MRYKRKGVEDLLEILDEDVGEKLGKEVRRPRKELGACASNETVATLGEMKSVTNNRSGEGESFWHKRFYEPRNGKRIYDVGSVKEEREMVQSDVGSSNL
ncbi:hypothetical protein Ancab_005926 [Ancistrocladus abbreviatus]